MDSFVGIIITYGGVYFGTLGVYIVQGEVRVRSVDVNLQMLISNR